MKTEKTASAGLGKIFGLVAILTVLSKFAGLIRDIVVLEYFGTSYLNDAYNYAYQLTGGILVLFGGLGGPFHSTTVAVLTPRKNEKEIGRLITQILVFTVLILSIICIIAWLFAPNIISVIAPSSGHTEAYKHMLWVETTRQFKIMLPLLVIAGIVGISYGILNTYQQFFWPSLSPAIASLAIIIAVIGFSSKTPGGMCLAVGTLVGAFGQMFAQIPGILKTKLKWGLTLTPQPGLLNYISILWPAAISTSVGQLTIYIDMFFTSQLHEGSWTAISNANRLIQLPLGVLLTAMLVPILPRFTEQVAAKKIDDLKAEFRRALSFLWFLALPLTALLFAVPGSIIQVLFERGHFNEASRILVTDALIFLVPSMFFYVARDLITRVFYAHHDSTTPYRVAMLAIFVKVVLDWALVGPLGIGGISLATSLVTVFNLALLSFFLRKKIGLLGFSNLIRPVGIMLFASLCCGLIAYFSEHLLSSQLSHLHGTRFLLSLLSLTISCLLGLGIYSIICLALHLEEPHMLLKRIQKSV